MKPPEQRFTDRVEKYIKYRPDYPSALVDRLQEGTGVGPGSVVEDLGAGTGIFSRQLLERGLRVFGVEPNEAMRRAGEAQLAGFPDFISCPGSAEATGLEPKSVDLAVAAQAFHWFDREAMYREGGPR